MCRVRDHRHPQAARLAACSTARDTSRAFREAPPRDRAQRTHRRGRRHDLPPSLRHGPRGHCVKAAERALSVGTLAGLAQGQEPGQPRNDPAGSQVRPRPAQHSLFFMFARDWVIDERRDVVRAHVGRLRRRTLKQFTIISAAPLRSAAPVACVMFATTTSPPRFSSARGR